MATLSKELIQELYIPPAFEVDRALRDELRGYKEYYADSIYSETVISNKSLKELEYRDLYIDRYPTSFGKETGKSNLDRIVEKAKAKKKDILSAYSDGGTYVDYGSDYYAAYYEY